jgi:tripartite-type tricarboxylate transporter receptor subunit TctC
LILAPYVNDAVRYESQDFKFVAMVGSAPLVLVTRGDLGVDDADALIEAEKKASTDKPLSYGSVGTGSLYHIMAEQLGRVTGTTLTHIPYRGGAPMLNDLMGGRIDFTMIPWSQMLQDLAQQNKVKIIGSVSLQRSSVSPAVPTVNEGKSLDNFAFDIWTGFTVPTQTPEPIREQWNAKINSVLADKDVRAVLEKQGLSISAPLALKELDALYRKEVERYRKIAAEMKLSRQ